MNRINLTQCARCSALFPLVRTNSRSNNFQNIRNFLANVDQIGIFTVINNQIYLQCKWKCCDRVSKNKIVVLLFDFDKKKFACMQVECVYRTLVTEHYFVVALKWFVCDGNVKRNIQIIVNRWYNKSAFIITFIFMFYVSFCLISHDFMFSLIPKMLCPAC